MDKPINNSIQNNHCSHLILCNDMSPSRITIHSLSLISYYNLHVHQCFLVHFPVCFKCFLPPTHLPQSIIYIINRFVLTLIASLWGDPIIWIWLLWTTKTCRVVGPEDHSWETMGFVHISLHSFQNTFFKAEKTIRLYTSVSASSWKMAHPRNAKFQRPISG